jgi:hypothetical protein
MGSTRPKLPPVSDEMRRVSVLIAAEVCGWPDVSTRLMFGLRAIYRKGVVFAMLPDKRSLEVKDGVAYKEDGKWKAVEISGEEGIGRALAVLEKAYATARRSSGNR